MIIVHCVVYDTLGSDMNPNNYFDDKVCEYMCMIVGTILWGSFEVLQTGNGRIVIWCIVCVCAGMYIVAHNMHMDYASID